MRYQYTKDAVSAALGAGTTLGAISGAGIGGFSAAGITSGLAALGMGSMLGGIFVAPALGYGAYRAAKWAFTPNEDESNETVYRKRSARNPKKTSAKKKRNSPAA